MARWQGGAKPNHASHEGVGADVPAHRGAARMPSAVPAAEDDYSLPDGIDGRVAMFCATDNRLAECEPDGPFAGHTFDGLGNNPPTELTPDDLLAVSLLDVSYRPTPVRAILEHAHRWSPLLAAVRPEAVLWENG